MPTNNNFPTPGHPPFPAALALTRKAYLLTSDSDFAHVAKQVPILWAT
jgi:hypothetical protein